MIFYSERAQPQVVRVEPQVGSVAYKKDSGDVSSPSRPSSLPMQSNNQSEPIPVPTQVKAYERIRSSSSPLSSPRKCGTEPSPLDSAKVWQLFLFYLSVNNVNTIHLGQSFFQEIFPKCWLFILQCQFICHGVIFVLILQLSSQNIKISPQPESKFSAPDIGSFSPPTGTCMWHINKSILIFNYINLYFVIMLHDL